MIGAKHSRVAARAQTTRAVATQAKPNARNRALSSQQTYPGSCWVVLTCDHPRNEEDHVRNENRTLLFTVDGDPLTTTQRALTPTQILEKAGRDPAMYYLVQVHDAHDTSYEEHPHATIHLWQDATCVSVIRRPHG